MAGSGANYFVGSLGAWDSGVWDQKSGTMVLELGSWATIPAEQLTVFSFELRSVTSAMDQLYGTPYVKIAGNYNISSQVLSRRYGSSAATWNYSRPVGVVLVPSTSSGRLVSVALGSNFGVADYSVQLRLGGTASESSNWISDSVTNPKIANGLGPGQICFDAANSQYFSCGHVLAVTVIRDQVTTFAKSFIYSSPVVYAVTPNTGQIAGAEPITVLGNNFGLYDSTIKVFIESRACESSVWNSNSQLLCKTPRIDKTVHSKVCLHSVRACVL
jgi:hypothetical protein